MNTPGDGPNPTGVAALAETGGPAAVVSTGPLAVLSPHLDDAVLSCAALLARPRPVDVLTVCAGTPSRPQHTTWDLYCGFADSTVAVAARRAENEQAFTGLPHRLDDLEVVDEQYVEGVRPPADSARVRRWLSDWSDRITGPKVVAVPVGAGDPVPDGTAGRSGWRSKLARRLPRRLVVLALQLRRRRLVDPARLVVHADHLLTRDAALDVAASRADLAVLLYEDGPYFWRRPGDDEAATVARRLGWPAEPLLLRVDRATKATRVSAYRSQLPTLYAPLGPLDTAAGHREVERYWLLAPEGFGGNA